MYKKGQAAMEFLMEYGWAILVVLVAIGALAYFGVLDPDKFLPDRCGCFHTGRTNTIDTYMLNETRIYECAIINKNIDYKDRKIRFSVDSELFVCVNNSMVIV